MVALFVFGVVMVALMAVVSRVLYVSMNRNKKIAKAYEIMNKEHLVRQQRLEDEAKAQREQMGKDWIMHPECKTRWYK